MSRLVPLVPAIFLCAGLAARDARPALTALCAQTPAVRIDLAHDSDRERRTKATLEQVLTTYDLQKYTLTRRVVIEEGAVNHALPVLTLNARFASSPDELLSSYIHEQLHWHTQARSARQRAVVAELRRMYPAAPIGLPEGADTAFSTYGHLVVCYLEIVADREFLGAERAAAVIGHKGHYTWIYATVLRDEKQIAAVVDRHDLRVK